MAINFSTGFNLRTTEPIDTRFVLSKAEMFRERYSDDTVIPFPSHYMCVCKDDGQLYLYDKKNSVKSGIGRFRPVSTSLPGKEVIIDGKVYFQIEIDGIPVQTQSAIEDGEGKDIAESLSILDEELDTKQNILIPGDNIVINNDIISATIPSIINSYETNAEGVIDYNAGVLDLINDIQKKRSVVIDNLTYNYLKADLVLNQVIYNSIDFEYETLNGTIDAATTRIVVKFIVFDFHISESPLDTYVQTFGYRGDMATLSY